MARKRQHQIKRNEPGSIPDSLAINLIFNLSETLGFTSKRRAPIFRSADTASERLRCKAAFGMKNTFPSRSNVSSAFRRQNISMRCMNKTAAALFCVQLRLFRQSNQGYNHFFGKQHLPKIFDLKREDFFVSEVEERRNTLCMASDETNKTGKHSVSGMVVPLIGLSN